MAKNNSVVFVMAVIIAAYIWYSGGLTPTTAENETTDMAELKNITELISNSTFVRSFITNTTNITVKNDKYLLSDGLLKLDI